MAWDFGIFLKQAAPTLEVKKKDEEKNKLHIKFYHLSILLLSLGL